VISGWEKVIVVCLALVVAGLWMVFVYIPWLF
jgi:hypothetical protein